MEFTEQEQVIIANAMCSIVFELEGAEAVLWAVDEVFFHDDQKEIPAGAAKTLGKLLRVYLHQIHDIILEYKKIVGENEADRVIPSDDLSAGRGCRHD